MRIATIGIGYVGLVVSVGLANFGNTVVAFDKDIKKLEKLKRGISPFYEPSLEEFLKRNLEAGRISFTKDPKEAIERAEVVFITVGTPGREDGDVDMSQLMEAIETIAENLKGYKVIVIKSTVLVGTAIRIDEYLS